MRQRGCGTAYGGSGGQRRPWIGIKLACMRLCDHFLAFRVPTEELQKVLVKEVPLVSILSLYLNFQPIIFDKDTQRSRQRRFPPESTVRCFSIRQSRCTACLQAVGMPHELPLGSATMHLYPRFRVQNQNELLRGGPEPHLPMTSLGGRSTLVTPNCTKPNGRFLQTCLATPEQQTDVALTKPETEKFLDFST